MYEWVQIQLKLRTSPRMYRLARILGCNKAEAFGHAVEWLCLLDGSSNNGHTGMYPEHVDEELRCPGLTQALIEIDWAKLDRNGQVVAVDYEQYNGMNTKRRCKQNLRMSQWRARKADDTVTDDGEVESVTDERYKCNTNSVTNVTRKRNKRSASRVTKEAQGELHLQRECNAENVTDSLQKLSEEEEVNSVTNVTESVCEREIYISHAGAQESALNGLPFEEWVTRLKEAHPACKGAKSLTDDALGAAREAYERTPDITGADTELLAQYLADDSDDGFFRPWAIATYFRRIESTLDNARRWKRRQLKAASPSEPVGFREWLLPLMNAHPACRKASTLAPAVYAAAIAAFERMPQAGAEYAGMLSAFYASKYKTSKGGLPFYRPIEQVVFFEKLEEVTTHAEAWAKETDWVSKRKRAAKPKEPQKALTQEQLDNLLAILHQDSSENN